MRFNPQQCLEVLVDTIKEVPMTEKQRHSVVIGIEGFKESLAIGEELAKRLEEYVQQKESKTAKK